MTDGTAAVRFQLTFKSGKPVYLQLVDQVKAAAASGAVHADEPLPSIRALAEELRVNRNTVAICDPVERSSCQTAICR